MTNTPIICLSSSIISIVGLCVLYTFMAYNFIHLISKIKLQLSYAFKSKTDFILQISPQKQCWYKKISNGKKKKKPHYPPPGYGIPPEKLHTFKKQHLLEKEDLPDKYHMTLVPAGLNMWFFGMTAILSAFALFPLISLLSPKAQLSKPFLFIVIIAVIAAIIFAAYKIIYAHMSRSVLSDIWAIWPEPCNHMLCSVPHRVKLSRSDRQRKNSQYLPPIYWKPKPQTPLFRQPRQYAPNIPTLQGVLLNFAIFDFFFYKKPELSEHSNILNVRHWAIYWMAPVWVSYLLLIICMVFYFWISKTWDTNIAGYLMPPEITSISLDSISQLFTKIQDDLETQQLCTASA